MTDAPWQAEAQSTSRRNLNVCVLSCDGIFQRYFLSRVAGAHHLSGVVLHGNPGARGDWKERMSRYIHPQRLVRHLAARVLNQANARVATPLLHSLTSVGGQVPRIPSGVPVLQVHDINSPEAVDFVADLVPDIVCVNGTNLLREPMLSLASRIPLGIINLHTGLSPYARGGNCNLFVLLERQPEYVGVTVHHIDPGIDSGDIILSAQTPMRPEDNYEMIEARSFRLGFDLMLTAIHQLAGGRAARVPQWDEGKLYLKRTGYTYEPWLHVRANRLLRDGLVAEYLRQRTEGDRMVRLVGEQA